ncbi:hypothetical protein GWK47_042691 [Chionoecetes opilio]|uniref:Major facilitator superfamily associated domain-containing protein n=1 Tax=Chionoecetes opilio TaxID=41210 RepID=A0A8J5CWA1_CHIOP|nr:hypothetical protein GWK47_042691 [Chionoecetes opilio]
MSTRRHLSWRARQGGERLRQESRKAAVSCWQDFTTLRLVPLKLTFFVIMGETGLIFTISPLIPLFAPLLAGVIADKIGNFRCILVFTVALSGVAALINVAIPPARTTPKYSENITFGLTCDDSSFVLTPVPPTSEGDKCEFLDETLTVLSLEAKNCGYTCPKPAVVLPSSLLKDTMKLKILQAVNATLYHVCKISGGKYDGETQQKCFRKNLNKTKKAENMPRAFQIHNLILPLSGANQAGSEIHVINYTMSKEAITSFECIKGVVPKTITIPKIAMVDEKQKLNKDQSNVTCHFHCLTQLPHTKTCVKRPLSVEHNVSLSFWLFVAANTLLKMLIGLTYTLFEVAVLAILKEFGYDYGLQRIYGSIGGMVFAPLSGLVIDYLGKGGHYTDYQNIEVVLLLLVMIVSGMCYGFIENFLPLHLRDLHATNWYIGLLTTISSIASLPFLALSGSICKKFGYFQCIAFGLLCYSIRCVGKSSVSFHLLQVNPVFLLISFRLIQCFFSSPSGKSSVSSHLLQVNPVFLLISFRLIQCFFSSPSGPVFISLLRNPVFFISFRLIQCFFSSPSGYSTITTYYWAAAFEVLEGVTTGLLVTSAIVYGKLLSSKTNVATLQGIMATLHYGLGKSAGSFLGGYLMDTLKAPLAFQIFSGISATAAFCYYLVGKLYIVPRQNKRLLQKLEIMKMPVQTISRREHRRSISRSQDMPNTSEDTLQRRTFRKCKSPAPIKENEEKTEKTVDLDETQMTQMTDLPADETITSLNDSVLEEEPEEKTDKKEESAC